MTQRFLFYCLKDELRNPFEVRNCDVEWRVFDFRNNGFVGIWHDVTQLASVVINQRSDLVSEKSDSNSRRIANQLPRQVYRMQIKPITVFPCERKTVSQINFIVFHFNVVF